MTISARQSRPSLSALLLLTIGMAVVVLSALAFQYIGGYVPCALCLLQRWPYYIGVPIGVLAIIGQVAGFPPALVRALVWLLFLIMIVSAGMGVYHAGVEWGWWPGPETCSTSVNAVATDTGSLFDDLSHQKGPSCTEASLRVLGLSFAGWNVLTSLALAAIAWRGARKGA